VRQEAKDRELWSSVADFSIYFFISEPRITNALKEAVCQKAIARFADRLPAPIVRALINATLEQEQALRAQALQARKAMPKTLRDRKFPHHRADRGKMIGI
jgi:hypothetical protein